MSKQTKIALIVALIVLVVLVGFAVMRTAIYAIPQSGGDAVNHTVYTVLLIALGLAVPYWMVKLLFHAAHVRNPQEKEVGLKDIPDDKEQLNRKLGH